MDSSRFIQWNIKYSGSKVQFVWFIWLPTRRAELKMDKGLVKHWCAAAPITFAQAQHSHSLRLASHCGVMRGVMCEGGVGEKGTEGLRESWGERERERCRGSWGGCVWKASDHGKNIIFFICFFGPCLQTDVWVQLKHYVIQARFTEPKQTLITDKKVSSKICFTNIKTKAQSAHVSQVGIYCMVLHQFFIPSVNPRFYFPLIIKKKNCFK